MARRFVELVLSSMFTLTLALRKGELLDMTYGYDGNSLAYPGNGFFQLTIRSRGPEGTFPWLEDNVICTPEHIGTHIDAPAHFAQGKMRVDDIPLDRLVRPAVRVDISEKAKMDRNYSMTVKDLQDWEDDHGRIPDGCLLLVYTGWGVFYPDRLAYLGTTRNDTFLDEQGRSLVYSPGVAPEAATWLVANRKLSGIGIDAANIDYGQNALVTSHQILLGANIYVLENVANLDQLPNTGAKVYALPMKIIDGSGAPIRIMAMLDEGNTSSVVMPFTTFTIYGVFLAGFVFQ